MAEIDTVKKLPAGLMKRGDTYHLRFKFKGTLVAESAHTKDLREAERLLIKRKAELHADVVMGGKRVITFHKAIDEYVETIVNLETKKSARVSLKKFKDAIENKSLRKVEQHEVTAVLSALNKTCKASSVKLYKSYWNAFTNWCIRQKYHSIVKVKVGSAVYKRIRWLTPQEQESLLVALGPRDQYRGKRPATEQARKENYDFTVLLLDTGLRYAEAAKLHWSQVDLGKRVLYVYRGKGGTPTTLALTNRIYAILVDRRKREGEYVFTAKAVTGNCSHGWMKMAVLRAGISTEQGNVSPHTMRHTFAATMIQNGIALNELQHLLGHASIQMTMRYAHFRKEDATSKAAEILNKQHEKTA